MPNNIPSAQVRDAQKANGVANAVGLAAEWKNKSDQMCMLSMWAWLNVPLQHPVHSCTIVLGGIRVIINWVPSMPRDASLSDSQCKFLCRVYMEQLDALALSYDRIKWIFHAEMCQFTADNQSKVGDLTHLHGWMFTRNYLSVTIFDPLRQNCVGYHRIYNDLWLGIYSYILISKCDSFSAR